MRTTDGGSRLSEEPVVAILRKHVWRWVLRPLLGLVLLLGVLIGGMLLYAFESHRFPRPWLGMGPLGFEQTRARQLDPQLRLAYEQELFEELALRRTGSKRFPEGDDLSSFNAALCARDRRWKEMAMEGFELAHIARQAVNTCEGLVFNLKGPMRRLQRLAEGGDVAAMCMMGSIDDPRQDLGPLAQVRREMVERGAALGHPECLWHLSRWTYPGLDGDAQAVAESLSLAARAVEGGAYRAAREPLRHFAKLNLNDQRYDERTYCWSLVYDKGQSVRHEAAETLGYLKRQARSDRDRNREERISRMSEQVMDVHDCVAMGWH